MELAALPPELVEALVLERHRQEAEQRLLDLPVLAAAKAASDSREGHLSYRQMAKHLEKLAHRPY